MRGHLWAGLVIIAAIAATAVCDEDAPPAAAAGDSLPLIREPRIFAYYSTTKMTKLKTHTATGISTCMSTAGKSFSTKVCQGRKKRMALDKLKYDEAIDTILDGTIEDSENVREKRSINEDDAASSQSNHDEVAGDDDRVKRALTIWSTDYSTLTLTSTKKISSYTLTVSVFCTTAGFKATCFF